MDPQNENQPAAPPQTSPTPPNSPGIFPAELPPETIPPPPSTTIQPTQPGTVAAPIYNNPPQPQGVPVAGLTPGFSQADALAMDRQARHKKRLMMGLGVFVSAAIIVAGVLASGILNSWKTITYDNGKGTKYELSFYSKYDVKNASEFGKTASELTDSSSSVKQLFSKVSTDGKAPLTLLIYAVPLKGSGSSAYDRFKDCPGTLRPALTVRNAASGNDIKLCAISEGNKDIIYLGVLKDKDGENFHIILAVQDIGDSSKLNTKKEAEAFLEKVDLKTYKADLEKILASLKPLD